MRIFYSTPQEKPNPFYRLLKECKQQNPSDEELRLLIRGTKSNLRVPPQNIDIIMRNHE